MVHPADTARLAVLIDADNAPGVLARELLEEVSKYGVASVRRAYGDWTTPKLRGWKEHLHRLAIQPVQQFCYTAGKNATDSALIIDAMDLLHAGGIDGFCLVSSDSDFTRLATRLRESGKTVYGLGERQTPEAFIAACDKFIFLDILRPSAPVAPAVAPDSSAHASQPDAPQALHRILSAAIEATARDGGWAPLPAVGGHIGKNHPSFDARNFAFAG